MTNESASTFPLHHFPSHKYDFGDRVSVLPLQANGVVEAIAYRSHDDTWHYRLTDLAYSTERWWTENELAPACSHDLDRNNEDLERDRCGLSPQNVTKPKT